MVFCCLITSFIMVKFINPPHPLGIKPFGNAFLACSNSRYNLGALASLSDELLLEICGFFSLTHLLHFGSLSKACYAFGSAEELWKNLVVRKAQSDCIWRGSWRKTALNMTDAEVAHIHIDNFYSDILYRPYMNAFIDLSGLPRDDTIPRLSNLSQDEFSTKWSNQPFILTEVVPKWSASHWDIDYLLEKHGDHIFRAECVDWKLRTYIDYLRNNQDESPLYLFDKGFVEKEGGTLGDDYQSPYEVFGRDYFEILGADRPDYRWLIIGPARSGSTFHKDPNGTSAWNAVITGAKFWIMFPPNQTPPGVFVTPDEAEVTSPSSIAEWVSGFLPEARRTGCLEGVCHAGEILHVPSGWWHLVVNLSESIAITQNFVPEAHLPKVLSFLKNKPDQISGFKDCKDAYEEFEKQLEHNFPEELARAKGKITASRGPKKHKWNQLRASETSMSFSFGFADE
ncbi:F-box protein [Neolecta irregularis DAH-3]|uniref:F-box protein n=1 Tax=Neolecta irregularis (strain DAH-3) TaxID=1198029 RepID=A0A1U7LWQ4_NEOID|nr:F-box protein [Neolecta irregularis DAH-3]|eukprot:OLL27110.1 F-box protein [Neolecta irregularis DAH-3]